MFFVAPGRPSRLAPADSLRPRCFASCSFAPCGPPQRPRQSSPRSSLAPASRARWLWVPALTVPAAAWRRSSLALSCAAPSRIAEGSLMDTLVVLSGGAYSAMPRQDGSFVFHSVRAAARRPLRRGTHGEALLTGGCGDLPARGVRHAAHVAHRADRGSGGRRRACHPDARPQADAAAYKIGAGVVKAAGRPRPFPVRPGGRGPTLSPLRGASSSRSARASSGRRC